MIIIYLQRLRDLREDNGLTQKEVARIIGCGYSTYRKYEKGLTEIPLNQFLKLISVYSVTADYLLGNTVKLSKVAYRKVHWDNKRLMYLRRKYHYSQKNLALLLHIDEITYRRYELGIRQVPISSIYQLSLMLGVSSDYVLGVGK